MVHSKSLVGALLVVMAASIALAGQEPFQTRKADLSKHSFAVAELKLTIAKFRGGGAIVWPFHSIQIKVENRSATAQSFDPNKLSLVSKDGKQVSVRFRIQGWFSSPDVPPETPQARSIAPGAFIQEIYHLNGKVGFPARLFYDGKELAVITD
ncbi:MAG: hypothetical protein AABO41_18785 [Acidobacteriota bacterium]